MQDVSYSNLLSDAKQALIGKNSPLNMTTLAVSPYNPKLYLACASSDPFDTVASTNPERAEFDAIMSAYASHNSFRRPHETIVNKATKLDHHFVNPNEFTPLDKDRIGEIFLKPFSREKRYRWSIGADYRGHPVYIPEDLVYCGDSRDMLYRPNDSGLAAHPNALDAVKRATLSRVKHDALMRTWFKQLSPYILATDELPEYVRTRIEYWHEQGRTLVVAQVDSNYGEVYLAMIRGNNWPSFVCGSSITIAGDTNEAITDAVSEAEGRFSLFMGFSDDSAPEISEIRGRIGHGLYYCNPENADNLSFLFAREPTKIFPRPIDFFELAQRLDLIACWLTERNITYGVVRVFSRYLVPISYGIRLAHSDHIALHGGSSPVLDVARKTPHCFI